MPMYVDAKGYVYMYADMYVCIKTYQCIHVDIYIDSYT